MLVFGTLLLGFKGAPARILSPPGSVINILQFVFALVFYENAKAQCSADHYGFPGYAHAVVQMHLLSNLPISVLWYVCTGENFLEERSFGVGGRCSWTDWQRLTVGSICMEPEEISHPSQKRVNYSAGPAPCSFITKPSLVSIKQLILTC